MVGYGLTPGYAGKNVVVAVGVAVGAVVGVAVVVAGGVGELLIWV
jgi:hypothetical protein